MSEFGYSNSKQAFDLAVIEENDHCGIFLPSNGR